MAATIDLNADLGESFGAWKLGDDQAMLPLVTSANVACGFHAGDPSTLLTTVRAARRHGVIVGAQVGYRDLAGFGRRFLDVAPADLTADVLYQLGALDGLCRSVGSAVRYLKPHGALYHAVTTHEGQAAAVVAAVLAYDPTLPILGPPGSRLLALAGQAGLRTVAEAFADRGYTADGGLVPRGSPGAVLGDPAAVAARVLGLLTRGVVVAVDGTEVPLRPESVCLHGDSPGAVQLAAAVRAALTAVCITPRPFAQP